VPICSQPYNTKAVFDIDAVDGFESIRLAPMTMHKFRVALVYKAMLRVRRLPGALYEPRPGVQLGPWHPKTPG
jgi:hypothetical protein